MSLNKIQLNPQMLAGLYPDSLLETAATTMPEKRAVKYLGNNQKRIAVIVNHPSVRFLPDDELSFLSSILNACKLSLGDIAIINFHQSAGITYNDIAGDLDPRQVLLFGVDPLHIDLPINFPHFQLQQFDGRTYLCSPALSELAKDTSLKQKLWGCLKTLFGI